MYSSNFSFWELFKSSYAKDTSEKKSKSKTGKKKTTIGANGQDQVQHVTVLNMDFERLHKLMHDIHDYDLKSSQKLKLLLYMTVIVIYIGVQVGLLAANFKDQNFIDTHYYLPFHLAEFWAVFIFVTSEAFILISAEILNLQSTLQMSLLVFNIIVTLMVAILFTLYPDFYEVPAHCKK